MSYKSRYHDYYGTGFEDDTQELDEQSGRSVHASKSSFQPWQSYSSYIWPLIFFIACTSILFIVTLLLRRDSYRTGAKRALTKLFQTLIAFWSQCAQIFRDIVQGFNSWRAGQREIVPREAPNPLMDPNLTETQNVRILRDALSHGRPVPEDLVLVRLEMEKDLKIEIPLEMPATRLRNRLKELSARLKYASAEERKHISVKLTYLFYLCFTTMSISFLTTLIWYNGGGVMPDPIDFSSFFGDPTGVTSTPFSLSSIVYVYKNLFIPFGWNWMSVVPYILGFLSIRSLMPVPFIGPFLAHILYLSLAIRFFWLLLPSFASAALCTVAIVASFGYPLIHYKWPHYIIIALVFNLAIFAGFIIALGDPQMRRDFQVQNPLLQLCTALGWCEPFY